MMSATRPSAIPEPAFADLLAAYGDPGRHYHGLAHIEAMLAGLKECRALLHDAEAVELAIWFHDAVYDASAADNEERSADLARQVLAQRLEPSRLEQVGALILATRKHELAGDIGTPERSDMAYFLDLDLKILGAEPALFAAYEVAVRREYAHVPDAAWRTGRAAVLQRFMARARLYFSDVFAERLELRARENLARSLESLTDSAPPQASV
ncbi:HD domain-containing protein [Labrys neptuniae]